MDVRDKIFIGGEWVKASSSDQISVINSSTEDLFFRVAEAKEADMDRAVAAARLASAAASAPPASPRSSSASDAA